MWIYNFRFKNYQCAMYDASLPEQVRWMPAYRQVGMMFDSSVQCL